jgi:uncharacterized protein (DUF58 family)
MLNEELLAKVKRIEVLTRKIVTDVVSGSYKSHFKGQGMQFSEHRMYMPGDDVRHIDWKVSARSKETLIKKYEEERELTVLLVVDVSGSESFGSGKKMKSEVSAEIAAMLAFAANHSGDRVGALFFSDHVEKIIPPKKGRQNLLRIVRDILSYRAKSQGTSIRLALESADRLMKHAGVVFVLSDFLDRDYEIALRRLGRRHDLVAIRVNDPRETKIESMGVLSLLDPESGQEVLVDTHGYAFKKWFEEFRRARESATLETFKRSQVETLNIQTKEDYGEAVVRFFRTRQRRRR